MGLFANLYDRFVTKPVADSILKSITPAEAPPPLPIDGIKTFSVPTGFNGQMASYNKRMVASGGIDWALLRSLSVNHETTRAAINVRKREIVQLGYDVVDVDDDTDGEQTATDRQKARDWITHIGGDGVRFREILDKLMEDTLALDACVFYKQRSFDGTLLRIIPIDAATIKLRLDEAGMRPQAPEIAYEQWIKGTKTADLTTEDLSYEMMNPRSDNPYGLSPIESLVITLDASMRAMLYNLAYLSDNTVPQGFLNVPDTWKLPQIKEYTEYLHALIAGPKNQAKIFPIPAGAKYIPTSKPSDFVFKDFFDYLDRRVCMLFDVTPQELGLSLQQYKENAEGQDKIQMRKGIKPLANFLQEIFTDLLRDEGGFPDFAFKFTGLDMRFDTEDAKTLVPLGILGVDEYRNDMGLKKLGVENFIIAGQTIMPVDQIEQIVPPNTTVSGQQQQPPMPPENIDVDPEDTDVQPTKKMESITPIELHKIARNLELEALEKSATYKGFHKKVQTALRKQLLPFTKEETITKLTQTTKADEIESDNIDDVLPTINITGFTPYIKWAATQGQSNALKALNIKGSFTLPNPKFQEMLGNRENYLIDSVDSTTKQYIVDQLSQGHENGLTNAEIAQKINDDLPEMTLARANTITNTETTNAVQTAELNTYQEQGVTKKVWVLSEDIGDVCGENADEGAIAIADDFSSGDDAPPAHPNCRCFIQADVASIQAMAEANLKKDWVTINGNHIMLDNSEGSKLSTVNNFGKSIANSPTEHLGIFDKQGNALITKSSGLKDQVGLTSSDISSIPSTRDAIMVHNHPSGSLYPSQDDFVTGTQLAVGENRIVSSEGYSVLTMPTDKSSNNIITMMNTVADANPGSFWRENISDIVDKIGGTFSIYKNDSSKKMEMPTEKQCILLKGWVTINGAHVLIGDSTGDAIATVGGSSGVTATAQIATPPKVPTGSATAPTKDAAIAHMKEQAIMQMKSRGNSALVPPNIDQLINSVDVTSAKDPLSAASKIIASLPAQIASNPQVTGALNNWARSMQQFVDKK